jgi:hypothetical protein
MPSVVSDHMACHYTGWLAIWQLVDDIQFTEGHSPETSNEIVEEVVYQ